MERLRISVCILASLMLVAAELTAQETQPAAPSATLVTLNLNETSADAAFTELSRQSNYPLAPMDERSWQATILPTITLSAEKVPFWSALRSICDKTGVAPYVGYGERRITLMPIRPGQQPNYMKCDAVFSGPFMLVAIAMQRMTYIDLANPKNSTRNATVMLMGFVEPKIKIVRANYVAQVDEAVDEKGTSLVPPQPARGRVGAFGPAGTAASSGLTWNVSVPIVTPPGSGEKIAALRGKASVTIQTDSQVLEIPDILKAKDVTRPVAGYNITIKQVTKTNQRIYVMDVTISRDEGLDQQQVLQLMTAPSARLVDEQEGVDYPGAGGGSWGGPIRGAGETKQIDIKLQFYSRARTPAGAAGEPTKLVWEFTTATRDVEIPFEFKDLPLP